MKTAMRRWVVLCVVGAAAAAPHAANALSPASNGSGDGEANVPFATVGADEWSGGVAPGQLRGDEARGKVAGRAARAPGRRAYRAAPTDAPAAAPAQTEADRAFEESVWTAP